MLDLSDIGLEPVNDAPHRAPRTLPVSLMRPVTAAARRARLHDAIQSGELRNRYQPIVELATGIVAGVEALVRWHAPGRRIRKPNGFISLAEDSGLIAPLTFAVLDRALSEVSRWVGVDTALGLSVNISPLLLSDAHLARRIATALDRHEFAPERLTVEITESHDIADVERAHHTIEHLRGGRVNVALDDLGCGFATISRLERFAFTQLKISKSLIDRTVASEQARQTVARAIEIARAKGAAVVAEGLESAEAVGAARELGCELGQGFFLSPPLTGRDLVRWLGGAGNDRQRALPSGWS
ncbi:MAG: EAL domain-containing protein [Ectothiorhodospiraceae bacterium]|nr:EAL domain-containing protein [Chromatiales bacterium]MCP5156041.1 EAL domain-containing protein [Ectothiorhodospiraceae bacterium]